jgi:RNA polymerase sigma factor (sigma-70 family)
VSTVRENESTSQTFAELYEEYLPKVYRYINYRINDTQITEDLTSTVFEKALTNFGRYSKDRASFSTWIFSISRNVVIDYYRAQGRRQTVSLDDATEVVSQDSSPEEELLKKEEREKLQIYLMQLPQDEQEIIRLKFGAELNNRQIARMLGLSESNVGTKLYRSIRKLRDVFQESENG